MVIPNADRLPVLEKNMNPSPCKPLELVCPAGNLPSLKTAVDHGADAVYIGFRDETNARHFPGLNFDAKTAAQDGRARRPVRA